MWTASISSLELSLEPWLLVQLLGLSVQLLEQQVSLEQPLALLSITSQLLLARGYGLPLDKTREAQRRY
jgi:hypothetical protein